MSISFAPPLTVYEMYFPEVWGRGARSVFVVREGHKKPQIILETLGGWIVYMPRMAEMRGM